MKHDLTIRLLTAGILFTLAAVLYSCGGGSLYGSNGTGTATALGACSLIGPADGAIGAGATPTLTWTPSTNTANYRVQIDTAGIFSGTLVINAMVGATTYGYLVSAGTVSLGTRYFWKVIAENVYGQAVAGPRSFTP